MLRTPNLHLYYPFEGNLDDASGNGNNGTANNITYVDCNFGKCGLFNGINGYIVIPNWAFNIGNSIDGWFDFSQTSGTAMYFFAPTTGSIGIRYNGTNFLVYLGVTGYTEISWTAPARQVHLCIIRTGSRTYDFYIDGVLIGTSNSNSDNTLTIGQLGRRDTALYYKGTMNNICFYNKTLSTSDIKRKMLGLHPLNG